MDSNKKSSDTLVKLILILADSSVLIFLLYLGRHIYLSVLTLSIFSVLSFIGFILLNKAMNETKNYAGFIPFYFIFEDGEYRNEPKVIFYGLAIGLFHFLTIFLILFVLSQLIVPHAADPRFVRITLILVLISASVNVLLGLMANRDLKKAYSEITSGRDIISTPGKEGTGYETDTGYVWKNASGKITGKATRREVLEHRDHTTWEEYSKPKIVTQTKKERRSSVSQGSRLTTIFLCMFGIIAYLGATHSVNNFAENEEVSIAVICLFVSILITGIVDVIFKHNHDPKGE